jgi:hypothetical protein
MPYTWTNCRLAETRIAQKGLFDLRGWTVKVGFRQSFTKDLAGVKDKSLLRRVKAKRELSGELYMALHAVMLRFYAPELHIRSSALTRAERSLNHMRFEG